MKNILRIALSSVMVTALLFAISSESHAKESRFSKFDANSDGKISVDEIAARIKKPSNAPKRVAALDVDGDGFLSPEEFSTKSKKKNKKKNK
ncbi:MAG: hypothetical protein ABJV04_07870 [Aliiglaciecola sp.]|uniref:hypothetical protein n=1 Tax=Aliiglaciecola sp. TaxID=1872441 RepID=UPI003298B168